MDVLIRFWNNSVEIAETRYFDFVILNRPNARNLFDSRQSSTKQLKKKNLLQISMDGLTVNWNVLNQITEARSEKELDPLFFIDSCIHHVLYGAFQNVTNTTWKIDKILKPFFYLFFSDSPARRDVCIKEGGTNIFPLRLTLFSILKHLIIFSLY